MPKARGAPPSTQRQRPDESSIRRSADPTTRPPVGPPLAAGYPTANPEDEFTPAPEVRMTQPLVGIVMGSDSDWEIMQHAATQLAAFGVAHETRVVSAHRTPDLLYHYAEEAAGRGLLCIIAGAGGAAHLPGMLAAKTPVPVLGVPVPSKHLNGLDSLLSIVQMPGGIPVATFAIGESGAKNAGLFAVALLARHDTALAQKLDAFRKAQTDRILGLTLPEPR